ncbi:hypothetical protein [Aquihabitans sp. McL0605]|uniref:hypothetical protein n=1 Tax=Aquihabitans sp. McL0605 TaxID=3415671 RepID=UPI003CFA3CEE
MAVVVVASGCSGADGHSEARGASTTTAVVVSPGIAKVPAPTAPVVPADARASVARVVREQHLDAQAAACVAVRFRARPALARATEKALTDVGAGCARVADEIVPTFVGSLTASQHLSSRQATCVVTGLYRLTSAQMDAMTSAMLNPMAKQAAAGRRPVTQIVERCA